MSIAQDVLSELDYELPATRRLLERLPSDKGTWKLERQVGRFR